jgi:hypothetical protein
MRLNGSDVGAHTLVRPEARKRRVLTACGIFAAGISIALCATPDEGVRSYRKMPPALRRGLWGLFVFVFFFALGETRYWRRPLCLSW